MYAQQIERILAKLQQLAQADKEYDIFGADSHRYKLEPVRTPEEIRQFEAAWRIELPQDYRAFLLQAGAGGAGPYYGLEKPEDGVYADLDYKDLLNDVSGEFPFTEEWNPDVDWYDDDVSEEQIAELEKQYFSPEKSAGMLRISNFGCGVTINLIVKGQSCGEIWVDDRANSNGIYPDHYFANKARLTFLDWYETWLDRSLEELTED